MRHLGVELNNETFPQTDICSAMFTQSELSGLLRVDRILLVSDVAVLRIRKRYPKIVTLFIVLYLIFIVVLIYLAVSNS